MRKVYIASLTVLLIGMNVSGQVQEMCDPEAMDVMDGEYRVSNNVWGDGDGVGDQCLNVDPDTSFFEVSLSTHDDPGVCSYPFIFKGCHWGHCTSKDNPFTKKISEIASAPFTWVINTESATGTWNASFEAWFDSTGSGYDYNGELMIWIDYNGGASPGGSMVGTVDLGGHEWDVYFAEWTWNYIAYRINTITDSVSLDLRDFIHDAICRGYIEPDWYIHNMEAGFEIWSDGQGLTSHSYCASITEGAYSGIGEDYKSGIKSLCRLDQNYPNPFNDVTEISYSISESAFVSIRVFDIYGREVQSLIDKFRQAGTYTVNFEVNGLPEGIYLYRMYIPDKIINTRRMIISQSQKY